MKGYFVVYLKDGNRFDFDERCNQVKYADGKVMIFKHTNEEKKTERVLAIIPYENIAYVTNNVEEDEEKGE